jgi:outer membrane PBP1 activator LpoA protein
MTLRFYSFLLCAALLVLLNACSTPGPVPVGSQPVVKDRPAETETRKSTVFDLQYEIQRDPSERSLEEVIELSRRMSGYQPEVALAILRSLESISSGQLTAMIDSQLYDPEFTEWLELALQTRELLVSRGSISAAAKTWADYHYGHVITQAGFSELMSSYRMLFPLPAQVAVLLPTEGGLASAANAIRDGILSAYLDQPGNCVLRFYSSGETAESTMAAYLQAREDGATQIVGPLRSESASVLASLDNPSVPILLLNEPAEYKPVYPGQEIIVNSLSLSQSEEVWAIAGKAISQGQKRAIVLVQDSAWGTRIESTFTSAFEQGQGKIPAVAHFNPALEDHSAMLTRLLKIDESEQRKKDLQSRLGIALNFEPSRRDDFDFIFMAASPQEGRELKPLLRYHSAGDVPVYAMSRIFSGKTVPAYDQDLNSIVFPITAWQLRTAQTDMPPLESIRDGTFGNLYALGQDAWHILPWIPLMQKDPDLWFPGDVGALRMQANGHLERQPAWAQFSAGQVVPYQWPDIR